MKKFKIEILVEDDGQDNNNFYDTDSLRIDVTGAVGELDLRIVQVTVEEC